MEKNVVVEDKKGATVELDIVGAGVVGDKLLGALLVEAD